MDDENTSLMIETLEARRALIREARNEGYLRAAEDLEAGGPEAVRLWATRIREGCNHDS